MIPTTKETPKKSTHKKITFATLTTALITTITTFERMVMVLVKGGVVGYWW